MKVKELQKTVNIAWSPEQQNPIYLAAGTAAQQLDASSTSVLELYAANLTDPGYDLELKGTQASQYRFHKVVWSPHGFGGQHANGLIIGGCEGGHIEVYSAAKMLAGEEALIAHQDRHSGPVRGLDINPFQANLLASAAAESEFFIWDLNNTTTPMSPGTTTQPPEDVQNIGWNRQVQHILATVYSSRCVIWDLRKNEPIIKLSDNQSRVRWRAIQWHPEIATQLWLASEEDQAPVVQLWDLRYATAPAKTMQIHQRGVLGLSWCPKDPELMISCGKDNKILCWNPNTENPSGEILSEVASTLQWYSDVSWCPRNPALVAASSLDGNVSIYSLFGGTQQQVQTSNKIADSFPGMDQFAQAPTPQTSTQIVYSDLTKPPKWMKRPAGASFGFGGRLIAYKNDRNRQVVINQVVTEPDLIERSNKLEEVLAGGNFSEYCRQKADESPDQHKRFVWFFLKANFDVNPKAELLNLLGYDSNDMSAKFSDITKKEADGVDHLTSQMAELSRGTDNNAVFDAIAASNKQQKEDHSRDVNYKIETDGDSDGLIAQALLTGNIEAAVELCFETGRLADAIIIAMTGGSELLARTQYRYLRSSDGYLSHLISALVTEDWSSVISQCAVDSWKEALAGALTHSKDQFPLLCERLGERLQIEGGNDDSVIESAILCYICAGSIERMVDVWLSLKMKSLDGSNLSNHDLQELIEAVMLLQKACELQGKTVDVHGKLADLLSRYAGLLAAQGALASALTYLGPSDDPELQDLKDRLYYALGHKHLNNTHNMYPNQIKSIHHKQPAQQPHTQPSFNRFNPQQPPVVSTLPQNQWTLPSQGMQNSSASMPPLPPPTVPSFNPLDQQQQQPKAPPLSVFAAPLLVNDPLNRPPRPSSVGSQGSTTTTHLPKSRYLLDPSVQSATPSYGMSNMYTQPAPVANFSSTPQQQPQFNQYNQYGSPTNANTVTSPPFSTNNTYNAPNQFGNTNYNNSPANTATGQFGGGAPPPAANTAGQFKPFTPAASANPMPGVMPANNSYLPGVAPLEVQPPMSSGPPFQQNVSASAPGWNDPPALKSNRPPAAKPQQDFAPANPITHPLFGVDPNQNQPQQSNGFFDPNNPPQGQQAFSQPPQQMNMLYGNQGYDNQMQQQMPMQHTQQQQPTLNFQTQAPPQQQHQQQYQRQTPEPPKPKAPIPEEYIYMQTVFNELRNQCIASAVHPQTKRKLEEVAKRLECLYDLLRGSLLTQNTLASLNQMVQFVQIGDYANGLQLHTQMVSGPDFSQIASFMPGLKVLMQSAMQLQVYLQ